MEEQDVELVNVSGSIWQKHGPRLPVVPSQPPVFPGLLIRAGTLGLPLMVAIIGGEPHRFRPLIDHYREAGLRAGHSPDQGRHPFIGLRRRECGEGGRRLLSRLCAKLF
jgi:alkanesulfonate monooxygenase SsuD/methylene tetrahydromethanopterin reductase-like flavin-dependent oxidoreductase (luciferase family)